MQDLWQEEPDEQAGWTPNVHDWWHRQLDDRLRGMLWDQPALLEALTAVSPNRGDPYRDALLRVTDWFLARPAITAGYVVWQDDEIFRPDSLGGGWKVQWSAVRNSLLRAVRDCLEAIEAGREAGRRDDQRRVEVLLRAEQAGTLAAGPAEPSRAALLARCGGLGERGTP